MRHWFTPFFLLILLPGCAPLPTVTDVAPTAKIIMEASPSSVSTPTATITEKAFSPAVPTNTVDINLLPLFAQAKESSPERYQYAVDKGASVIPTPDGKSFYVLWTPKKFDKAQLRPMIVTLHGHESWAFDEFYLWHPYAEQRGYGIIALQWWLGTTGTAEDYYPPEIIYPIFEKELLAQSIEPGKALFHGFSRGSANSYAVAALDHQQSQLFGLVISNAGGMMKDFPPNAKIINGDFGKMPFSGMHWVMYCGEKDPNPERDGCIAMNAARDFVTRYGAVVDLLIQDPTGDHGGFHQNPTNVNKALDVFDALLRE